MTMLEPVEDVMDGARGDPESAVPLVSGPAPASPAGVASPSSRRELLATYSWGGAKVYGADFTPGREHTHGGKTVLITRYKVRGHGDRALPARGGAAGGVQGEPLRVS